MMKKITLGMLGVLLSSTTVMAEEPRLNLNIDQITVSGLSSGGFMATQMHVAYADWVSGAGIVAAGPYFCARNSLQTALQECLTQTNVDIDIEAIESQRAKWQDDGKVADIAAMQGDKVWLLHGQADTRLSPKVANALVQQYAAWITPENLKVIDDKPFAHHMPTLATGSDCEKSEAPFLGHCQYDAAGEILSHILPNVNAPSEEATGTLESFNQHAIVGDAAGSLAETGYLYVPKSCSEGEQCQVHISFHGCNQFADAPGIDNTYAKSAGFNRWADTNNLVILYPQTQASNLNPFNPQGCWDWWGYSGDDYATRDGAQLKTVVGMVNYFAEDKNGE